MSSEEQYLRMGNSIAGFSGKQVLEVGGCSTPSLVQKFSPESWTAIDINPKRFEGKTHNSGSFKFSYHNMSATKIEFDDNSFDRVFSINCFEHVDDVEKAFSEIARVLRPGGIMFTLFGPIWSSPVGHHTWIEHNNEIYHFMKGVFPDWYHLTNNRTELKKFLGGKYDQELAEKVVNYVYDSKDLNRLADGDYEKIIKASELSTLLKVWKKRGTKKVSDVIEKIKNKYAGVDDPRKTELLLVMSKSRPSVIDIMRIYFGLFREGLDRLKKKFG